MRSPVFCPEVYRVDMSARFGVTHSTVATSLQDADEFEATYVALPAVEKKRLKLYGITRIQALGPAAHGRSEEELLDEAVMRLLRNGWRPFDQVDLARQLKMAMKSIASVWQGRHKRRSEAGIQEESREPGPAPVTEEASPLLPHEKTVSPTPRPDEHLWHRELLQDMRGTFADDPVALEVANCLRLGFKGPEAQQLADISKNEYQAAVRRLRYWWTTSGKERSYVN